MAMQVSWPLYAATHMNLTEVYLGIIFALFGVSLILVQAGLVGALKTKIGERLMALIGCVGEGITLSLSFLVQAKIMN